MKTQNTANPPFTNEMELYKQLLRQTFGEDCMFDVEQAVKTIDDIQVAQTPNLYYSLYGKTLSMLEATLDKDKIEPAKTIIKQLFRDSYYHYEKIAFDMANDYYNYKAEQK